MSQVLTPKAMRLNRWIAGVGGLIFIGNCVRTHDYWGAAFGTLAFLWVALRFPLSDRAWATTGKRTIEVVFAATALAAVWITIRG